ncbi:MAG: preprotein translocase subunit SecE [Candidatus Kerfeldbacteria bacterium]|nr:preprotein translocase subunit SecE [Candidatus Kerfeldbacteria bacterium]
MANRLFTYFRESKDELKRVVWPSRQETTKHTLLVIGISLGVAAFLGVMDYFFSYLLQRLIS